MSSTLEDRIAHIESLLMEINGKLDNFLGMESLTNEEKQELIILREEVESGQVLDFNEVFKD